MPHDPATYEKAERIWAEFRAGIDKVEQRRKLALLFPAGLFAGCLAISSIGLMDAEKPFLYIAVSILIAALPAIIALRVSRRGLWLNYKPLSHLIVRRILGTAYKPHGIIEAEDMDSHGILPAHCRLYREEGYTANIHGYRIRFQEIDAVRSFDSMSVRQWRERTRSSGLYVLIDMKRDLPAHTVLTSTRNRHTFLKNFLRHHFSDYKEIGLVSPRFKNQFAVYSTDQIEARLAFHPAFMEKFMDIAALLDADAIEASFKRNQLLIHARYKKDLFQLGHFFKPLSPLDLERLIHEVALYEDILAALRLNPYTAP